MSLTLTYNAITSWWQSIILYFRLCFSYFYCIWRKI